MRLIDLPHMTAARAAALEDLGVTTPEELVAWVTEQLAEALKSKNERIRTRPEHARHWLEVATGAALTPLMDAEDDWETYGEYSVMFQERIDDTDRNRRVLCISHHRPDHNDIMTWPELDTAAMAEWMLELLPRLADDGTPGEDATGEFVRGDGDPTSSDTLFPAAIRATTADLVIDLMAEEWEPRPIVPPGWRLEVTLPDTPLRPIHAALSLTSVEGERNQVRATGEGHVLASEPTHLPTGYHETRLDLRDADDHLLVEIPLSTIYQETSA